MVTKENDEMPAQSTVVAWITKTPVLAATAVVSFAIFSTGCLNVCGGLVRHDPQQVIVGAEGISAGTAGLTAAGILFAVRPLMRK